VTYLVPRRTSALAHAKTLLKLVRSKQIFPDKTCMDVLFHRLAFKYNGDGWYDVHPLVAEIPEFVDARNDLLR
jgi:hypothetical protein